MGDEQRNLQVVRQIGELWNAGDFDGVLALYDDDVEMITDPTWPDPPAHGKEAFARSSEEWRAAWEKIELDIGGSQAVEPDKVIAEGAWDTRGAASGIPGSMPFGILFTLRAGLIVRMEWFREPSEARRAAGLG
jgi:ketosteroid isomerase-like protein